jgi:Cryptococcal mannosyltransferase 1
MTILTTPSAVARKIHFILRWRAVQALLLILIFVNLLTFFLPNRLTTTSFPQAVQDIHLNLSSSSKASQKIGRVFIASLLKDNEDVLRAGWSDAIVNLTCALGPENVWVSVHESGSQDGTRKELQELDHRLKELGAGHGITMADVDEDMRNMIPKDGPGWIDVRGRRTLRRIPWLAELRNMNIEPLRATTGKNGLFDKVLFLNDVVFTSDDALELLSTRNGDYAAACGFDYHRLRPTISFYDQFATRDIDGQELTSLFYPYFAPSESRDTLLSGSPAQVKSCWSGIAAFDAAPFQDQKNPLRFRAVDDSLAEFHLEASECCLINYDNPMSASKGVWMNPNVRVGYDTVRYEAVHRTSGWPSTAEIMLGRFSDLFRWILRLRGRRALIDQRYEQWAHRRKLNTEVGSDCLINKMMVVSENGIWSEIREPQFH